MEDVLLTEILCGAALNNQPVRLYFGGEAIQITPGMIAVPTEVLETAEVFVVTIEEAVKRGVLVRGSHETAFMVTSAGVSSRRRLIFNAADVAMVELTDINFTPKDFSNAD